MDSFKKKLYIQILGLIVVILCIFSLFLPISIFNPSGKPVRLSFITIFGYGDEVKGKSWLTYFTITFVYAYIIFMIINALVCISIDKNKRISIYPNKGENKYIASTFQPCFAMVSLLLEILCFFMKTTYNDNPCKTGYGAYIMGTLLIVHAILLITHGLIKYEKDVLDKYTKDAELIDIKKYLDYEEIVDESNDDDTISQAIDDYALLIYEKNHNNITDEEFETKKNELKEKYGRIDED